MHTLLKSLEEPPDSSCFVLVTSHPDALLPTIRSRCARLRFGPLDDRDLVAALVGLHGLSEQAARGAAPLAGGSLGLALAFASEATEKIRRGVCGALGEAAAATSPDDRFEVGRAVSARGSSAGQPAADRDALAIHLRMLLSLVRDVAVVTTGATRGAVTNADLTSTLESLAGSFGRDRAVRAFSAVERALGALDRNASPKIVADWLAFQL
jgi:DNA polymerase-3 subunit delta'